MLAVLVVTQPAGLLVGLLVVAVLGADSLSAGDLALAFAGGAAGMAALAAFYTALSTGTMSVVAPIAAMGVVVPVAAGLTQGETPGAIQLVGLPLAIIGVVVLSYEEDERPTDERRAPLDRARAALGAGLRRSSSPCSTPPPPSTTRPGRSSPLGRRGAAVALAAVAAVRPDLRGIPGSLPILLVVGALDIAANTLFAIASTMGVLPVVAVGGSMYPAFTIVLAHLVLGERLILPQRVGVAMALAGVVLIAAGA